MKRVIILSICIILSLFSFSQKPKQIKLIDLYGDKVEVKLYNNTYIITFSTQSCHNCYLETARFLEKMNYFSDTNIHIIAVISDFSDNIESAAIRKYHYNNVKDYFPKISQVYYNSKIKGDKAKLLGYKFSVRSSPKIISVTNNKIEILDYDVFIELNKQ